MSLLWQAKSLKDFTKLELVRPEQAQDLGNGVFRAEVKFGDKYPGMTEQRSLWDISQLLFREGDECAFAVKITLGTDWIGWVPKDDELGNWPGNPQQGTGGMHGGSFLEFHHAPNDGNWNNLRPGSAPFYLGANDTSWRAYLLETDPKSPNFGGLRPESTWLRPMKRGIGTEFVVHTLWSTDPAKGYIEILADGQQWVPKFRAATLYPNTSVYPVLGIYRRLFIGDPSMRWQAPARSGVTYPPGFFPAVGGRVFPLDGGYPQSVQFENPRIGTTKEDVMATPTPPAVPAPTPTPALPANFDPAKPSVNPNAGAALAMSVVEQADAVIAVMTKIRKDAQELLNKGAYKP